MPFTLRRLDAILDHVTEQLARIPSTARVSMLERHVAQCRIGIVACRRQTFGPLLQRLLVKKVLTIEREAFAAVCEHVGYTPRG